MTGKRRRPAGCFIDAQTETEVIVTRSALACVCLALVAAGCDAPPDPAGAPDAGTRADGGTTTTPPRPDQPAWAGVHDATGLWDLAGPFTGGRTFGDAVAEMMVDEIVKRAGVPSALAGRAEQVVSALVADRVKAQVDLRAPAALQPHSPLMTKLALVFGSTEVASTISLRAGLRAGSVAGTEEIRSFTFGYQGARQTLAVGDLLAGATPPAVTLAADWAGKEAGTPADTLAIDQHAVSLRLGKMVLWVVDNVLHEQGAASLSESAASLIDCLALSALLLDGKDSFSFGVELASYTLTGATLREGCTAVTGLVKGRALGLFDLDAGVEVGGNVQHLDLDGDRRSDRLRSQAGFGGVVTKLLPGPLAPRVPVRFEAVRRPPT
jgi:hypothetical protein